MRLPYSRAEVTLVPQVFMTEIQEANGKLVRQGLLDKRLHKTWHFYLKTNESLPEARTIIVVAMPRLRSKA